MGLILLLPAPVSIAEIQGVLKEGILQEAETLSSPVSISGIAKVLGVLLRRRHYRKRGVSDKEQPLSDLIGAPLVVYLREEEVAGLHLKKHSLNEWASNVRVQQPNVLDEALLAALRYLVNHHLQLLKCQTLCRSSCFVLDEALLAALKYLVDHELQFFDCQMLCMSS